MRDDDTGSRCRQDANPACLFWKNARKNTIFKKKSYIYISRACVANGSVYMNIKYIERTSAIIYIAIRIGRVGLKHGHAQSMAKYP